MLYHINRIILSNIRLNFCVQSDVFVFFQKCFGLYTENLAKIFCFVVVIMKGNKSPPLRQRKEVRKWNPENTKYINSILSIVTVKGYKKMKLAIFKKNTAGAGTKKYPLTNYRSRSYNPYAYQTSILQMSIYLIF